MSALFPAVVSFPYICTVKVHVSTALALALSSTPWLTSTTQHELYKCTLSAWCCTEHPRYQWIREPHPLPHPQGTEEHHNSYLAACIVHIKVGH